VTLRRFWPATALRTDTSAEADRETLLRLNCDYIASVQNADVRRFEELLADDFLCSHPDGSLVDRATFLADTARPVAIKNLEARDVVVRPWATSPSSMRRRTIRNRTARRRAAATPCLGKAGRALALRLGACDAGLIWPSRHRKGRPRERALCLLARQKAQGFARAG